jgi:hypothetical protein
MSMYNNYTILAAICFCAYAIYKLWNLPEFKIDDDISKYVKNHPLIVSAFLVLPIGMLIIAVRGISKNTADDQYDKMYLFQNLVIFLSVGLYYLLSRSKILDKRWSAISMMCLFAVFQFIFYKNIWKK